jgi:hypothetical protein
MAGARQARTWETPQRKSPLRGGDELPTASAGLGDPAVLRRVPPDSPVAVRQ